MKELGVAIASFGCHAVSKQVFVRIQVKDREGNDMIHGGKSFFPLLLLLLGSLELGHHISLYVCMENSYSIPGVG